MSDPSSARARFAVHYLGVGHTWTLGVRNDNTGETGSLTFARKGAPLVILNVGESRVVQGVTVGPYGSAGLYKWTSGGSSRWARVIDFAGTSFLPFEPASWEDTLQERSWGGSSLTFRTYDAAGEQVSTWVEGRSVSVRVREYEGGSLTSDGELFSGFVETVERDEDQFGANTYTITAVTIERFLAQEGMDTDLQVFVDSAYAGAAPDGVPSTHVFTAMTLAQVIRHLLRHHLRATINAETFALAEVIDLVTDSDTDNDDSIGTVELPAGNLMQAIVGFLPYGLRVAYSFRDSQLVVSATHEAKTTPDSLVDQVNEDECYAFRRVPGKNDRVREVIVEQATGAMTNLQTDPIRASYGDSSGTGARVVRTGYWFANAGTGAHIARALSDRLNSDDRLEWTAAGAAFGIFNKAGFGGGEWVVERVRHDVAHDWLGGHECTYLARNLRNSASASVAIQAAPVSSTLVRAAPSRSIISRPGG